MFTLPGHCEVRVRGRGRAAGPGPYTREVPEEPRDERDDERDEMLEMHGRPPHPFDRVWFHPSELGAMTEAPPEPPKPRREWGLVAVAALCGAFVTVGVLAATGLIDSTEGSDSRASALAPTFAALAGSGSTARLAATVGASVLAIRVTGPTGAASGTGVALGGDRVLTNASLLLGADTVRATTTDGRVLDARILGSDTATDLAVLSVVDARVPGVELGTADGMTLGTWVLAVGASGGERRWASPGVVSGVGELVPTPEGAMLPGMIGTDIDPGRAGTGGPIVDQRGAVVAILSRSAPGHALPIDVARDVAAQLSANGRASHGWLGVAATDASDEAHGGARVVEVVPGGPGEAAGLRPGDVITALEDDRVSDLADLIAVVARRRPTDPVSLTVRRGPQRVRVSVRLGERTPDAVGLAALRG